ncbi:hypothetical protein CLV51_106122 [Chitinophaga niastensis]|uniref:Uncharacterized protein n=1 Tax=Chitinophaga niastensis TaxID=536980 RepID=A0A2P8HDE1_CHINA|nr:hypothetical protein [Chitinophaga niastensis]PSL44256.1 hypothetical protein CLV51_106122 [Chitinophaga niastensis]
MNRTLQSLLKSLGCFLPCVCVVLSAKAQRLDAIGKEPPLKVNGGVSLEQVAYFSSGLAEGRRDPYNFFFNGNLNISIYGWSVPFSFNYSNQSRVAFQQPFNQYGLTPTYKWITGHIGYTSMNFSGYTLSGHLFNGVGVDLAPPGHFRFSAMYGRLQKAVEADTVHHDTEPAYKRMGYGFKASYTMQKNNIDLIVFRAKDDDGSIAPLPVGAGYTLTPQDNLVIGVNATKQLFSHLLINAEVAWSMLTRDTRAISDSLSHTYLPTLGLLQKNSSTALYHAYKTSIAYGGKRYTLGIGYEWVAPEYKTLGAYYFTNDFENITGNLQLRLLKDRLTTGINAGVQRNNLKHDKLSTMHRWVGALNMTYAASKKLNVNFSYSNFQSFVNIRSDFNYINQLTPYDNLDTLNYTQISTNATLGINYRLSQSKEKMQMILCNVSYMQSADMQGGVKQASGAVFYNLNTAYSLQFVPKDLSVTLGFNANTNNSVNLRTVTLGPTFGVNKSLMQKKLRTAGTVSWNGSYTNGKSTSRVLTTRVSGAYSIKKAHSFNLSVVGLNRTSQRVATMSEVTTTLGYNYNF